jgi:hypothetical protein
MISVKCKICNTELTSTPKVQSCGCDNQLILTNDKITAVDLNEVIITKTEKSISNHNTFSKSDLEYQENRRKRKVRKLNFEVK